MIKKRLQKRLDQCFAEGCQKGFWSDAAADCYAVEEPKHENQGDFSTNMAMVIAGREKKATGKKVNPREIAGHLIKLLEQHSDILERAETAGPGFVNFFIKPLLKI